MRGVGNEQRELACKQADATPVRAQTLPVQGSANRIVRGLLRAPLLCRLAGRRLLVVYLVGRRSGRHYAWHRPRSHAPAAEV